MVEEGRNFRSPTEGVSVQTVIKRLEAEDVSRTEQLPAWSIPDCEREVPDDVFGTFFSPALIGTEHEFDICMVTEVEACRLQGVVEFFSIIDPSIQCQA